MKIQDITEVVVKKSIADQILSLPNEAVVLVRNPKTRLVRTVIHRTGPNGWLITRSVGSYTSSYIGNDAIRVKIQILVDGGHLFELADPGAGNFVKSGEDF